MASKEVYFRGKTHFCKLLNRGDEKYGAWSTGLYLDDASYALFLELKKGNETTDGIMNDAKIEEDGPLIQLKRPHVRKTKLAESMMTAPIVLDKHNLPWPQEKIIGNGSDVIVKCEYYTFKPPFKSKRGSAIRLISARVEDHVPYEMNRDLTPDDAKSIKGLVDQKPMQYF